ncbi:MAG: hypothetical protein JXR37_09550 [Kiritimatiellae bacterium]|nr:hypothetical protein [Kiritimatiellia bacterium]
MNRRFGPITMAAVLVFAVCAGGQEAVDAPEPGRGAAMRPIKPVAAAPEPGLSPGRVGGALAGVAAAAVLGLLLRRVLRRAAPAPVPADVAALAALARLDSPGPAQLSRPSEFYACLCDIVREYVQGRFGIAAPKKTTEELLREAAGMPELGPSQHDVLQRFLESADRAKFARHPGSTREMAEALGWARRLVEETRPARA